MRELFVLDMKNYKEDGKVGRRPSVRGIIVKDGYIAMMHSLKYNYYKLPGGGIEPGETYEETLVREVLEESGLIVKTETIKEFGYVRRIEKGKIEDIFIQDNYYFTCETEEEPVKQQLDDYEEEEGFTLEYVTVDYAVKINEEAARLNEKGVITFAGMLNRENKILILAKEELGLR